MDQYKAMDSRKIDPKPTFVRRAAKALISKVNFIFLLYFK